ncbi:PAS domain S-box protein [Tepidibacillus infernus]|uniref:histidine kinase n=1 Tax=Tepidibacillus decaturensis TaxID=1413211 RepID=A0A135L0X6_9BACI|nr:PAS domain S-box protein [Tepidibacillus decaturensis]KXG42563.1 hypothetical protein U473_13925 [Tepidibacillus decaturensis]
MKDWSSHHYLKVFIFILVPMLLLIDKNESYDLQNQLSPYLFWGMLLFSILLAVMVAKSVEKRTQMRLRQLKEELDSLRNTGKPLSVADDHFGEIAQSVNDINENLSNKQRINKAILDSIPLGIIFYDDQGKVMYVNQKAYEITGYTKEEIERFTVKGNILNHSEYVFWKTLHSGESFFGFESFCPTKDGREIPVMTSTKPLYDSESKQMIGIISTFIDISEQNRLRKVEQHAKVMLDHISDGVITVDNFGVINGFNRGAEEMTGFKTEEVLGKYYDDVFIKRKTIFTKLTQTLRSGREYSNYKKEMIDVSGEKVFLMITTRILRNEQGKQIGAMGIYKDITLMVELEQQIQRAEKLAVVGELAAGTAHEIRNPLTTIKGFIQVFENELKDNDKKQYIHLVLDEINRINEIIKEMLLLANPSDSFKKWMQINQIIKETITFMSAEGAMYNVELVTDLQEELPLVFIDEGQIKQVFVNMIRNAIQAMKKGGIMEIASLYNPIQQRIEVIFTDHGEGIPEEQLPRVYEPFYTTKHDGTGLGIPVSFRIMKNHDGDLQIFSTQGEGTKVVLFFPIQTDDSFIDGQE